MRKKKPTFVRMTISLSARLKERMDKVADVNWSATAARAFENKLGEIASAKEKKEMFDVVSRLRASKNRSDDEQYTRGKEFGAEWARDDAGVDELGRLESLYNSLINEPSNDWHDFFDSSRGSSAYGIDEQLYFILQPDNDGSRSDSKDFWERAVDGGCNMHLLASDEFLRGFAEGALDVWLEVKDQV